MIGSNPVNDQLRYPVDVILKNLGTHEGMLYGKTVVSAGECIGLLLPHLLARGIPTLGIDLFYFANFDFEHRIADTVRDCEQNCCEHLKTGDA